MFRFVQFRYNQVNGTNMNGLTYKGVVLDEIGEIELDMRFASQTCVCGHSRYRHTLEECNIVGCNCKGFGATNLDWLIKNGVK